MIIILTSFNMKTLNQFLETKGMKKEEFDGMTAEKKAEVYNELNELNAKAYNELKDKVEKGASSEDLEALKKDLADARDEQFKQLNETLAVQGLAIKNATSMNKGDVSLTNLQSVEKGLEDNAEALKRMAEGDKRESVSFKAAGTMLISGNVSGGNVPVEQRIAGVNNIASRRVRLLDIVSRGTASSNVISWVYQANKDGAAGGTAEGALKNQIDFDLVVTSESVKKRTAFIKVSTEMIGDIDFMRSEINNELMRELLKDIESQVYSGTGLTTNLTGIKTVATAFAAGSFALAVDNANEVDVLTVAANQIAIAEQARPTHILMNPSDVTKLKMVKVSSSDKRYVERLAMVAGNLSLDGIPILETTLVTVGTYLIGAFDMATVYDKGAISIEIGRDADDFTKNLVTVLAEWRGLCVVKNNDRTAFVTGTFATDMAALETA